MSETTTNPKTSNVEVKKLFKNEKGPWAMVVTDLETGNEEKLRFWPTLKGKNGNYNNPAREQVLDNGSALSGGLREIVSSRSGLSSASRRMAELILSQYVLTFGPGGGTSQTLQHIEVKRPGVRVLAPGWTTR